MANNTRNILVGAARVLVSNGTGTGRPDLSSSVTFPWNVNNGTGAAQAAAASVSTPAWMLGTASAYWREVGFTNTGVEVSYEPGYTDVMVDQLLDAARLFKQSVKITLKTEISEGTLENLAVILGQSEQFITSASTGATTTQTSLTTPTASVTQLALSAGALGDAPVERTIVLVGNAPQQIGTGFALPSGATGSATAQTATLSSSIKKERVYVARRVVQVSTTAHGLKRDGATTFPVQFRCLPDVDNDTSDGTEYGFIIDRVYG